MGALIACPSLSQAFWTLASSTDFHEASHNERVRPATTPQGHHWHCSGGRSQPPTTLTIEVLQHMKKRSRNGANAEKSPRPIVATSIRLVTGHAFTRRVCRSFHPRSFDPHLFQCREPLRTAQRAITAFLLHGEPTRQFLLPVSNILSISAIFGTKEGRSALRHFPAASRDLGAGVPTRGGGPRIDSRDRVAHQHFT
jgi:hypothetical protein